jgi:hypothetical protein
MLVLNAIWAVYNIVILSVGASVAREQQQRRREVRVDARVPLTLIIPGGRAFTGLTSQLSRTGTTACFDVPVELRGEADVMLRLRCQGDQCEFDARVVSVRGNREIHLLFPRLTVRQERFLVEAIYARPDAWVTSSTVDDELPFASFWQVVRLAVRGLGVVVAGVLMPVRALARLSGRGTRRRKRTQTATASMIVLAMLLPGWGSVEAGSRQSVQPIIFSNTPRADDVKAAVIAASWFGMVSDGTSVRFPVSVGDLPRGHAIVLVRRGSSLESTLSLPEEPRTLVTIRENPRDIYGNLLVIAGESPIDAARTPRVKESAESLDRNGAEEPAFAGAPATGPARPPSA